MIDGGWRGVALAALTLAAAGPAHAQEAQDPGPAPADLAPEPAPADPSPEPAPPVTPPSETSPITIQVRSPDAVDPTALRASLERDLGVRIELVAPDEEGAARVVIEMTPDGRLLLRVRREGLPPLTRETVSGADRDRTTVTVSLLVSNLVRDEAADVLALLEPEPAPEPEPPTVIFVAPETPPAPSGPPASPAELAPPDEAPPPDPELADVPVGVDFVPGLGMSTGLWGRDRRAFSLGVLGAFSGRIDGAALSSVIDIVDGDTHGLQLAGVHAHAHDVEGAQLSGVSAVAGGRVAGLQLGGVVAATGRVEGGQLSGVVAVGTGPVHGLQLAGVTAAADRVRGAQLSALLAVTTGSVQGLQLGTVTIAGHVEGAQLGVVNVAGEVQGAQLGVVNVAGRVRGLQLGLFNVAEEADAAIGLFSVHRRGHSHLRAEIDTNGSIGASFVHRGPVTYSIVSAAVEPFIRLPTVALGLGLGARAQVADIFHLDFEGISHVLLHEALSQAGPDMMFDVRVLGGFSILEGVSLYAGLGFRTYLSQSGDPELGSPLTAFDHGGSRLRLRGWPMLYGGVELF